MRTQFIKTLTECAKVNDQIFLITIDMGFSVLENFEKLFPNRFLNVGIAEQNAIGVAAGLAMSGKIVFVYSIVPFVTMRCFEQIRVDLAYQKTNVKLVGVGGGLSYGLAGATHHSIEDIAIMRSLPNMTVLCPGDPHEVKFLVEQAAQLTGPTYIRLGKNGEANIHPPETTIRLGKAAQLQTGKDFAIITTSNMLELAQQVCNRFSAVGTQATLINLHTIKPLDVDSILPLVKSRMPIFTLEEHSLIGGLGSAVSEIIAESGVGIKFKRFGLPDEYCHQLGSQEFLRNHYRLNAEAVFHSMSQFLENSRPLSDL